MFLRQVLITSRVGQLAPKDVPVLEATAPAFEAAAQMRSHSHGSALVYQQGVLAGIVTERDLLRLVGAGRSLDLPLSEVMTASPTTVAPDDTLLTVIKLMDEGGYRRLPVVAREGTPVGIIDVKTVVHFLVEHIPAAVYNQAPKALLNAKDREGA